VKRVKADRGRDMGTSGERKQGDGFKRERSGSFVNEGGGYKCLGRVRGE